MKITVKSFNLKHVYVESLCYTVTFFFQVGLENLFLKWASG